MIDFGIEIVGVMIRIIDNGEEVLIPLDMFLKYTDLDIPYRYSFECVEEFGELMLECSNRGI